ncbi:unnamed protein product [Brassica oleracea var. botrytis]
MDVKNLSVVYQSRRLIFLTSQSKRFRVTDSSSLSPY